MVQELDKINRPQFCYFTPRWHDSTSIRFSTEDKLRLWVIQPTLLAQSFSREVSAIDFFADLVMLRR